MTSSPCTVHGERVIYQIVKCEFKSGAVNYLFDSDVLINKKFAEPELFVVMEMPVFRTVQIKDKICGVMEIRNNCPGNIANIHRDGREIVFAHGEWNVYFI